MRTRELATASAPAYIAVAALLALELTTASTMRGPAATFASHVTAAASAPRERFQFWAVAEGGRDKCN